MSKSVDLKNKVNLISKREPTGKVVPPAEGQDIRALKNTSQTKVRTKNVRISTDLAPQDFIALKKYCNELAIEMGVARVTHSDVVRELVKMVILNDDLAGEIRQRVERLN